MSAEVERTPTREELRCVVCLDPTSGTDFHHIIPRSVAPDRVDDPLNKVAIHRGCHDLIGAKRIEMWYGFSEPEPSPVILWRRSGEESPGKAYPPVKVPVVLSSRHNALIYAEDATDADRQDQSSAPQINENSLDPGEAVPEATDPKPTTRDDAEHPLLALSGSVASDADDWRAEGLVDLSDEELVQDFNQYRLAGGVLLMESYRRVEAFRLKYAGVGEEGWKQHGSQVFGLPEGTLADYSRRWRAFQEAMADEHASDYANVLQTLGPGAWAVISKVEEEKWVPMVHLALNVVADRGSGRGLTKAIAIRASQEGLSPKPKYIYRCPHCGRSEPLSAYRQEVERE
jgi:hypothetical protein